MIMVIGQAWAKAGAIWARWLELDAGAAATAATIAGIKMKKRAVKGALFIHGEV
jgi:hypothetical protein